MSALEVGSHCYALLRALGESLFFSLNECDTPILLM